MGASTRVLFIKQASKQVMERPTREHKPPQRLKDFHTGRELEELVASPPSEIDSEPECEPAPSSCPATKVLRAGKAPAPAKNARGRWDPKVKEEVLAQMQVARRAGRKPDFKGLASMHGKSIHSIRLQEFFAKKAADPTVQAACAEGLCDKYGNSVCTHGKADGRCKDCCGHRLCPHNKFKSTCVDCSPAFARRQRDKPQRRCGQCRELGHNRATCPCLA